MTFGTGGTSGTEYPLADALRHTTGVGRRKGCFKRGLCRPLPVFVLQLLSLSVAVLLFTRCVSRGQELPCCLFTVPDDLGQPALFAGTHDTWAIIGLDGAC